MTKNYHLKKEDSLVRCSWCEKFFLGKSEEEKEDPKKWISRKDNLYVYNQFYIDYTWDLSKAAITDTICPICYKNIMEDLDKIA